MKIVGPSTMPKFALLGCLIILGLLAFLRDTPLGVANFPGQDCVAFQHWIRSKTQSTPEKRILPPQDFFGTADTWNAAWSTVAKDILGWAGWPFTRMQFASFQSHTYSQLLDNPNLQSGAFLIVVPGPADATPRRRKLGNEPWITASPAPLADALPLNAFKTLALALESGSRRFRNFQNIQLVLGNTSSSSSGGADDDIKSDANRTSNRGLHRFHIEVAPSPYSFPLCRGRGGACAIWEGSTGRIILDSDLARRMISSSLVSKLLDRFTEAFASTINDDDIAVGEEEFKINEHRFSNAGDAFKGYSSTAEFVGTWIAKAATAAISALLVSTGSGNGVGRQPLWWCLTCPVVLGLLAPFVINFGLAAAAEQLCAALQLPSEECSDLWWGAFALAMVLSLGSAVPIVYVCRLPDCIKRALMDRN